MIFPSSLAYVDLGWPGESPTERVQRGSSETARCASTGDSPGHPPPLLAGFFNTRYSQMMLEPGDFILKI